MKYRVAGFLAVLAGTVWLEGGRFGVRQLGGLTLVGLPCLFPMMGQ